MSQVNGRRMKIQNTEVINKITNEILNLFKIDFDLQIENYFENDIVTTKVFIDGKIFIEREKINPNEILRAEIHRLVKKNLYVIFIKELNKKPVPYGILHGVRPIKIIHKWIEQGEKNLIERLKSEYLVSDEKSKLLCEIALKQKKLLKDSDERTISVYVGIPFCVSKCLYCSFASNVLPKAEKIEEYLEVLTKEIYMAKKEIERYKLKVESIYIGGGTPTSLPNEYFEKMMQKVTENFYSETVKEYTVECGRPDTINTEKILMMKKNFVSRVSVNPQTMNQKTLKLIGRRHSPEEIIRAYKDFRRLTDFEINMDLILGLPNEKIFDVIETVEEVLKLKPNEITVHALAIKRGSKLQMDMAEEKKFNLPSDEEVRKMSKVTEELIREAGYAPYYLYRQGYISGQIENIGYSRDKIGIYNVRIMNERQTIIGIGAAATTKAVDLKNKCLKTSFNAKDLNTYITNINYYIERKNKILKEIFE